MPICRARPPGAPLLGRFLNGAPGASPPTAAKMYSVGQGQLFLDIPAAMYYDGQGIPKTGGKASPVPL